MVLLADWTVSWSYIALGSVNRDEIAHCPFASARTAYLFSPFSSLDIYIHGNATFDAERGAPLQGCARRIFFLLLASLPFRCFYFPLVDLHKGAVFVYPWKEKFLNNVERLRHGP